MRAVTAAPLIDDSDPAKSERACADAERSLEQIAPRRGALARPGFAPHAIYSLSERSLRWVAERSAELGVPMQIHLSETEDEVEDCLGRARRAARRSTSTASGMLGPQTVLAHGCWLDRAELELIAERGATVVTNPVANLKLAVGRRVPVPRGAGRGVEVGLGTDGPGSNNSLDLLSDAKTFALLQKNEARDPAAVTASETLAIAHRAALRPARRARAGGGRAGGLRAGAHPTTRSSRSARSTPGSSTRRPARSWTRPWSPGGC